MPRETIRNPLWFTQDGYFSLNLPEELLERHDWITSSHDSTPFQSTIFLQNPQSVGKAATLPWRGMAALKGA